MSIGNLQIDESLKTRLSLLLNEFESYRISNMENSPEPTLTTTQKVEIEEKKESFFKKFFFSDF